MRYASAQKFGGQRASIGRSVLLKLVPPAGGGPNAVLASGTIESINMNDCPDIRATRGTMFAGGMLTFAEVTNEADVDGAPLGSWMWPPRV